MAKHKKTRAERNAIRKQGLKEIGQGYKQWLVDGSKKAAMGAIKGAFDGAISGDGIGDKIAKGAVSAAKSGIGGAIKDVAQGTWKASKGIFKAIFNDLAWYTNYPELMSGVGGANFNTDDSELFSISPVGGSTKESKALIATHYITLTNGSNEKARDMVFTKIKQSIRRANSGADLYTEQQLNLYYMFIRNIVAMFASMRRMYSLVNKFSSLNLSAPACYAQALGFDYADFKRNAADVRQYLNQTVEQMKVYVPVSLPVLERTGWMFSNLFTDSNDAKHQIHAFVLYQYPYWNGNFLTMDSISPTTPLTFAQYASILDNMIVQLKAVCPAAVISGDMIKAFNLDRVLQLPYTDENYTIEPGYSEEVLTQIQNEIMPANATFSIDTDAFGYSYVKIVGSSVPGYTISSGLPDTFVRDMNTPMINFYKNQITPAEVVGASRLIVATKELISTTSTNFEYSCGTEVVAFAYVWAYQGGVFSPNNINTYMHNPTESGRSYAIKAWSHIDWMQRVNYDYEFYNSSQSQLFRSCTDIWDFNNYATSSYKAINQCHDLAYESLHYVPSLTKVTSNVQEVK